MTYAGFRLSHLLLSECSLFCLVLRKIKKEFLSLFIPLFFPVPFFLFLTDNGLI